MLFYRVLLLIEDDDGLFSRNDSSFTATPAVHETPCTVNKRRNIKLQQITVRLTLIFCDLTLGSRTREYSQCFAVTRALRDQLLSAH